MARRKRLGRVESYPNPKRLSNKRLIALTNKIYSDIIRKVKPRIAVKVDTLLDYDAEVISREM